MTRSIVYFVDSDVFGGVEQALLNLLSGLDRRRWRPIVFHHDEPGLAPLLEGARALDVELRAVPRQDKTGRPAAAITLYRELRAERPTVFHAHLNWQLGCRQGLAVAAAARVPARVATVQLFVDLPSSLSFYVWRRIGTAGVHRYIAVSRELGKRLETSGVPGNKIQVVHNGVPLERYIRPATHELRRRLVGDMCRKIVFTAARLHAQKGHRFLLQAATLVPDAMFVLAGDGPDRDELEMQAQRLGLGDRVLFLGYREDIADLLATCDVFVLPSLYEGLPLSILEAMAAGRPIICSAIGGSNEAVSNGDTGLLVQPGNPTDLARAINVMLSNPDLGQRFAAAAKARVMKDFSATRMAESTMRIYEELSSESL
jgi:glycosyltransferase involved in cell wall biosynthesis